MRTTDEFEVVVSARLEREQREQLERLAREGDRTLSQQMRVALREYLAELGRTDDDPELLDEEGRR
jgi:predicted transcriptional regulator